MRNIKCSDCAEYHNEWCEKIIDSPHPDMFRDCQYWHERNAQPKKRKPMTLKEAIEHCEEKAKGNSKCAEDYTQLMIWLIELEERRRIEVQESLSKYIKR